LQNLQGDVFRAPERLPLLAICVGAGAQTLCMTSITLCLALLGFLSPVNRGGLLSAMLSLWVLASSVNGYASARLYGAYGGVCRRKLVTMGSAFLLPGLCFSIFFSLNLALWLAGSSGAVPVTNLILLLFIWFGVSVPLVFAGSHFGYKRQPVEFPVRTNQLPRQIPTLGYRAKWFWIVLGGIFPFVVVSGELRFVLNVVAHGQLFLNVFSFTSIVFLILIVTCAETSIIFTSMTLSNEHWAWNWQAFLTSASSGGYMFAWTQYFLYTRPSFGTASFVSILQYTAYSLIMSSAFALLTGCVGYYASSWFVFTFYRSLKCDR
jgi:transmembrane 9 superfamily member 2/4